MPIRLIEGEEPLFETLDRARGLSNLTTNDLLVDRHGFVWIATNGGLHRFDGRNFYTIDRDPGRRDSLASRRVYRLAETPEALWIGFVDGKLQRLDMATGVLTSIPLHLPGAGAPHSMTWMRSDAHQRIWLLTNLGLLRFDPTSQQVVRVAGSLQAAQLSPDGHRLLMVTDDFQIRELKTDSLVGRGVARFSKPDGSRGVRMAADDRGLWLSLGTQLWRFDAASASLRPIDIPALPIMRMAAERNGTLWMSTESYEGLYRLDLRRRQLSLYRYRPGDLQGLRVNIIKALAISADGDLWIGGFSGGVSRVRVRSGVARMDLKGSRPELICGLYENLERQLFVSLCERVIRLDLADGKITELTPELERARRSRKSSLWVNSIIGDGENGLWMVTASDGLLHWRPGRATVQIPHEQELVNALLDEKQRVWVPHVKGLAVLLPGSQELREVSARTKEGAFEFGRTSDVAQGPDGTLLVGSPQGLVQYWPESTQVRRFLSEEGNPRSLSDDNVILSYTDPSGRIWVGTFSGLNRMMVDEKGESAFRRYGRVDGLPDTSIYSMLSDRSGALWVATDRGLARWDPRMDRFQSYLQADGIPDVSVTGEAGLSGRDGNLYFGTDDGLWRIDIRGLQVARSNPTVLSGYEIGEKRVINLGGRDLQAIKARYLDRRLTFQFAALGDPRNLFYRLAGFDDSWQSMPANLTVGYHQLPPGAYRLEVSRRDGRGQRVQDLAIPVTITPPIWRTTWAYAGYILAVAAALAWLVRAYVVRRRRRREYFRMLREQEERLRLAMSASGDVMIEIDLQNNNVTETGDDRSHHSNRSLRIPDYLALVHPDDVEPVSHYFEALQRSHAQDLQIEYRRRAADGDWKWVRLRGQFIERHRNGDVHEMFTGMVHDITQERSDLELRLRTDQLRMQAEVRGQFLAVISHEIRTPLNGVVGMIELLDATPLDKDQSRMLAACKDSASILMSIINDFLDLSKIESGKLELELADVPVRDLVDIAASGLSLQARNRGLDLDIHVAPQVPSCIVGDWVRLRQVLDNLISNAVKFTERGGVEIAMYMDVPGELRLTVADSGIGMDQESVDYLFQPFRQASAATARRFGGTGLGLSIVKHLVEIMGGASSARAE